MEYNDLVETQLALLKVHKYRLEKFCRVIFALYENCQWTTEDFAFLRAVQVFHITGGRGAVLSCWYHEHPHLLTDCVVWRLLSTIKETPGQNGANASKLSTCFHPLVKS